MKISSVRAAWMLAFLIDIASMCVASAQDTYSLSLSKAGSQFAYVLNSLNIHGTPITIEAWVKLASQVPTDSVYAIADQSDSANKVTYLLRYQNGGGSTALVFYRDAHF